MKKISIIIPCYNAALYLQDCWDSLKNQTIGLSELECIFVDDASTDDTWARLQIIEQEAPESVILLHLEENLRQGGARNRGISLASGQYLQFLDSDDWLEHTACERLYRYAEKYDCDLIQFNHCNESETGSELVQNCEETAFYEIRTVEERKILLSSALLTTGCWNKFYRRSMVKSVGAAFAEHCMFEEPLFVYPQFFTASRILTLKETLYHCRIHAGSTMQTSAERLIEHPLVQWKLYEDLKARGLLEDYGEEIEFYLVWTYYVETWINRERGGQLSDETLREMRTKLTAEFPNFRENPYLLEQGPAVMEIFSEKNF